MDYDLNSNDYYKILGIDYNSDQKTIKKAYHKLAIKYHPDKNLNNKEHFEKLFKKIYHAYISLSNEKERTYYDFQNNYSQNENQNENQNNFSKNNNENNNDNMFQSFFKNCSYNNFENNNFSYNFSNLDGNIDINYNYGIYTNFDDEYNKMNQHLNKFKKQEASFFQKKDFILKIPNSTKVFIKSKNIYGYIKDFQNNLYTISTKNDGDFEIPFNDIQQILKAKLVDLKGDYSHLNDDYCDIIEFKKDYNRFFIHIYGCDLVINNENIIINNNSLVKIVNLKNNKDLNNKWGIINAFDFNLKKYLIQVDQNKLVKVSYKNIII